MQRGAGDFSPAVLVFKIRQAEVTVTAQEAVSVELSALVSVIVTVVEPAATPVTTPALETVAVPVAAEA